MLTLDANAELRAIRPDLLLVSNALYEEEVAGQLRNIGLEFSINAIAG